jgi:hypothetical protein
MLSRVTSSSIFKCLAITLLYDSQVSDEYETQAQKEFEATVGRVRDHFRGELWEIPAKPLRSEAQTMGKS